MDFLRRCHAEIDLDALDFNMNSIQKKCPDKKIIAVAKANCYGHSDIICGKEFYRLGIRHFAVSNLHEAERLREIIGDNGCFLLVFGYIEEERFPDILKLNLTPTAGSVEFSERLNRFAASQNAVIPVNIALDTGMSRVGVNTPEEIERITAMPNLKVTAFYTHFPAADVLDEDNREFTLNQHKKFLELTEKYGLPIHCQNSGGVAFYPDMKSDFIRPGLIPYGLSPNTGVKNTLALKQVMTLKSVIDQLKIIPKNTDIGYGRTYKTDSDQLIAVVPTGYADGYSRLLSNKGMAIVNGVLCPIRGRVCMDQMMLDVTEAGAKIGDEVILYSGKFKETCLDRIADTMGTISNEVVCALSARVPRVAVRNGEVVEVVNER
ncbi:MAG: alanine racemase [Firmicutes bacterium]|nr:alanine racemase [[Eubacterium] siraeum]MCM1488561.1 alanine racemase [Bacillota bacterium]